MFLKPQIKITHIFVISNAVKKKNSRNAALKTANFGKIFASCNTRKMQQLKKVTRKIPAPLAFH